MELSTIKDTETAEEDLEDIDLKITGSPNDVSGEDLSSSIKENNSSRAEQSKDEDNVLKSSSQSVIEELDKEKTEISQHLPFDINAITPYTSNVLQGNVTENTTLSSSNKYRARRVFGRKTELQAITENVTVNIHSVQPSTSRLQYRRQETTINGNTNPVENNIPEENDSFNDSLDRYNDAFLIGVWHGPPEFNPLVILTTALGLIFLVLVIKLVRDSQPVYA